MKGTMVRLDSTKISFGAGLLLSVACVSEGRSLGGDAPGVTGSSGAGDESGTGGGGGGTGGDDEGGSEGGQGSGDDSGGSSAGTEGGDDGSGGIRLDVGAGESAGGEGGGEGCQKVDFLFVVDSSGSMAEEQANLVRSFPGFITSIRNTLAARDYHIMVVDADSESCCDRYYDPNSGVSWYCDQTDCSTLPPAPVDDCRNLLGAGVVHPWGGNTANADCGFSSGARWMTSAQPDLDGTFACAATVGITGDTGEQQAGAAVAAISSGMNGPGGCNEGFLREDAILVVTIITDEDDGNGPGPQGWYDDIVAAKNGNPEAVVMLGILGDSDQPGGLCTGGEAAPNLRQFVGSFTHSSFASICEPDFGSFLAEAVSVVDVSCEDFVPPG